MALVGVAVLVAYVAAGLLTWVVLVAVIERPPDLGAVALVALVATLGGGYLSFRIGTARLLAGIDAVELPRRRAPALYRRLDRLGAAMDRSLPPILIADLGAPNALSIGGPRRSAVVLDRRLLSLLTVAELEAIVAHELAHVERKDAFVQTLIVSVMRTLAGIVFLVFLPATLLLAGAARSLAWFAGRPHRAPDVEAAATRGVELIVGILLSVLTLLVLAHSRRREFAADRRAAEVTGRPVALARALAKIQRSADPAWRLRALLTIHGDERAGTRRILSTHPLVEDRIDRLLRVDDGSAGGTRRTDAR